MKLIVETLDQKLNVLKEAKEDGKKNYYIEGTFLMGKIQNRNGRSYPTETLAREVDRYTKMFIETNRAYGELGHPSGPGINLDRVSHIIKELKQDGDNFTGRAKITETPMGKIVMNLLDEGANLGVSSRGMGTLKEKNGIMEVQDDFMLATAADIVADPSAPDAFVRGIMENVEWVYEASTGSWIAAEALKKDMRRMTVNQINEQKFAMFERFLDSLAKD